MSNASNLVKRFKSFINDSCVDCNEIVIDDVTYVVTTGTGKGILHTRLKSLKAGLKRRKKLKRKRIQRFVNMLSL